jgi:hypothetical protein
VVWNMRKTLCRLLSLAAAVFIILSPWPGDWPFRSVGTPLRPLPSRPPAKQGNLPYDAFRKAVEFLKAHRSQFSNRRFITIIDYTKPSTSRRLFLINMESGEVQRFLVSHGKNSGWLYATRFSNRPESYESPLGFFRTGRKYYGGHGPSLELCGLQKGINDNSICRGIVMHGAHYAGWGAVAANRVYGMGRLGRSLGCPAIPMEVAENVIDRIKGGSLLYMHAKNAQDVTTETQRARRKMKLETGTNAGCGLRVASF